MLSSFHQLLLVLCFISFVFADTEILNFDASEQIAVQVSGADEWHILSPKANEKPFNITPAPFGTPVNGVCSSAHDLLSKTPNCPHEIWIKLDLDEGDWKTYGKFSLRISWPGSYPAKFHISIINPLATASRFAGQPITPTSSTRVKFARIRVVDIGVISPLSALSEARPVPFIVILEPLYFGVIPATLIPFLWVLLPVVLVSALLVPYVNAYLQKVASAARRDIAGKKE